MKNPIISKINSLNKRNPSTISQWLKYQQEYLTLKKDLTSDLIAPEFSLGYLMPVNNRGTSKCPKGMSHLFKVKSGRFEKIVDYNSTKVRTRRGWRTKEYGRHEIYITSIAVFKGRKLEWLMAPSDVVKSFILPEGWTWKKDELGICAVDPENIDYHLFWTDNITIEDILSDHSQNKEKQRQQLYNQRQFESYIENTFVNFTDARNAGSCVYGILEWAKRKLGVNQENILDAPWLHQFPAKLIYRLDPNNIRVRDAINQAYLRETTISI